MWNWDREKLASVWLELRWIKWEVQRGTGAWRSGESFAVREKEITCRGEVGKTRPRKRAFWLLFLALIPWVSLPVSAEIALVMDICHFWLPAFNLPLPKTSFSHPSWVVLVGRSACLFSGSFRARASLSVSLGSVAQAQTVGCSLPRLETSSWASGSQTWQLPCDSKWPGMAPAVRVLSITKAKFSNLPPFCEPPRALLKSSLASDIQAWLL